MTSKDAYTASGVDSLAADSAVGALVSVLATIDTGRESRTVLPSGHYANVLAINEQQGIALSTDGVGTKVIVAQQAGKFDTIGIDCVAMNVNDVICVGAEPLAVVDYLAVEQADAEMLKQIAVGLKRGAELAGVEIPGGELAQLKEVIRGAPSPYGFDLVGTCFGTVDLGKIVRGDKIDTGDLIIGLPSSGVHSNGLTLARKALLEDGGYTLDQVPSEIGRSLAEELLEPTEIYVRAVLALIDSSAEVHGLAHITSGGMNNLLRLNEGVGYQITDQMPVPPIFELIQSCGSVSDDEMREVFNLGTGFCCIVAEVDGDSALSVLREYYSEAAAIGTVIPEAGTVNVLFSHGQ